MIEYGQDHSSEYLDSGDTFDFIRFCQLCRIESAIVILMIEEGVIEPVGQSIDDWQFTHASVMRAQKANRLHRDLNINLPGVALSIDLLEEIEDLRTEVQLLKDRLDIT